MEPHPAFPGVIDYHIAIDPGKMTGWARIIDGNFLSGQAPLMDILDWAFMALETGLRPIITVEDFIFTQQTLKKTRQTWSTEGLGALRWMAHHFDCEFEVQTPADAKRFADDDKLKAIGWWNPTKGGHANDAARHLMVSRVKRGLLNTRDLYEEV